MNIRTWKRTGIVTGILALVVIVIGTAAPRFLDLNRYHGFIVAEVQKATGGQVTLGRISWGFTHRLWLEVDGFSITSASAFAGDIELARLYASISIPRLLTRKVIVKKLQLESPGIKYRLEPGTQDSDAPAGNTTSAGVQLPVEVEIEHLVIEVDRLELSDSLTLPGETLLHVFTDIELAATSVAPEAVMAFNVSLQDKAPSGLGSLKAQGTFSGLTKALTLDNPQLKLNAVLKTLSAEIIKPYLKDSQINDQLSGSVSLQVNYVGDLGENLHAQGSIDLGQLRYANPELWEVPLAGAGTTLGFQISLDPERVTAEKISLKRGSLSLDAQGVVHGWNQQPVISAAEFSSNLPLGDLAPLIPWKLLGEDAHLIRPILEGGGKLVINKLTLAGISLEKPPATLPDWLHEVAMTAQVNDITVPRGFLPVTIERINGQVTLEKDVLLAENVQARVGPVALPDLNIRATGVADHFKLALRAKGPLQLASAGDQEIEKLLLVHGLKDLDISADIDVSADFDQHKPEDWTASGTLRLKDVSAKTDPAAVVMEHLTGEVTFRREKSMQITAQNISTRINQAPLQLSGKVSGIGSPNLLVDGRTMTKGLDLAHLAELVPALKNINVQGVLDMDVDVHVPYSAPAGSRLKGTLSARNAGFQLASSGLVIARGDLDLALSGNTATIKKMSMAVNEQPLLVSGRLSNPVEPDIKLMLTAPDLDIDRLLPPDKAAKPVSATSKEKQHPGERKPATANLTGKAELPPLARKLTADVQLQADRARYIGMHFEKLNLDLLYKQGLLKSFDLNAGMDKGQFATSGSADLRDLQHIRFTLDPDISALPLAAIAPALGVDSLPLSGPLTLKGQLRGTTGSSGALLAGLAGKLDISLGPGNLNKVGKIGDFFAKLFSIDKIGALFSGRLFKDLSSRGIYFKRITAQPVFNKGMLDLGRLHLDSDVMTIDARGSIDLSKEKMDVVALLVPLATVDDTLNLVPLVGDALDDVSKVRIDIRGPLDDPEIETAEAREIEEGIESEVKQPGRVFKDVYKGLEKIF